MNANAWFLAVSVFVSIICNSASAYCQTSIPIEKVPDLVAQHMQARDVIQNYYCKLHFKTSYHYDGGVNDINEYFCEYWFSRLALRLKVAESKRSYEYVWKDGTRISLETKLHDGKPHYAATKSAFAIRSLDRCDAMVRTLLHVNIPLTLNSVPLEDAISAATRIDTVFQTHFASTTFTTIRLVFVPKTAEDSEWRVDVVLDSSMNQLIRKVIHYVGKTPETSDFRRDEEVIKQVEIKPGVYFPTQIEGKSGAGVEYGNDSMLTEISALKVDQTFPPETFELKLPNGILLVDGTKGVAYTVDPNGKATSGTVPLGRYGPPPNAESVRSDEQIEESKVEERSRTSSYLIFFAIILTTVITFLVWRNRRVANVGQ